jgi:hypothetical protein
MGNSSRVTDYPTELIILYAESDTGYATYTSFIAIHRRANFLLVSVRLRHLI